MMDLEYGSTELRLCSGIFCPTVSDVCHRADLHELWLWVLLYCSCRSLEVEVSLYEFAAVRTQGVPLVGKAAQTLEYQERFQTPV